MKRKLQILLNDIKDLTKKILERNMLIILLSTVIFIFLFFTENGIIHQYYLYNMKKNTIQIEIQQKQQQLEMLNKKLKGLNSKNTDVMEEVIYQYQNKDPYLNRKKVIVKIDNHTKN